MLTLGYFIQRQVTSILYVYKKRSTIFDASIKDIQVYCASMMRIEM